MLMIWGLLSGGNWVKEIIKYCGQRRKLGKRKKSIRDRRGDNKRPYLFLIKTHFIYHHVR